MERTLGVRVESRGINAFSGKLDNAIGSLMQFRGAVGLAGAALAAFSGGALAASIGAASSFEEQMVEVEKVTDPETAREMAGAIREMARELPVATSRLTDIAATAGRLGVRGEENISRFTEAVAMIGVATDLQADTAATNFAKIANALSTPVDEVENMGSSVNALSNNVAASSSAIVDAMRRAAPAAGTLGVEFEDLAAITATLVASGMRARRAGTRMNRAFQNLASNSGAAAEQVGLTTEQFNRMLDSDPQQALMMVVESISQIESKSERLRVAEDIFGASAAKVINTLATNFDDLNANIERSNEEYEKATSLQDEFDTAASTFNARLRIMKNRFNVLGIQIGNVLLPALTKLLNGFNRILGAVVEFNERTNGVAGAVTLVTGLVAGLATTVAFLATKLGVAGTMSGALGTALSALTGPIGIVLAAIATLGAMWATNFGRIRDITSRTLSNVIELFDKHFPGARQRIAAFLSFFSTTFTNGMRESKRVLGGVLSAIETAFEFVFDAVGRTVEFTFDAIFTAISAFIDLARGDWQSAVSTIKEFFERNFDRMRDFAETWAGDFIDELEGAVDDAKTKVKNFASWVKNTGKSTVKGAFSTITDAIQGVFDVFDLSIDWPEPPAIVKKAFQGTLNIDWPDPPDSLPDIPHLAHGGVVTQPTTAVVGEAGPEAVVPLDKTPMVVGGKSGAAGTTIAIEKIIASSEAEGRAAARGLTDELRSAGFRR